MTQTCRCTSAAAGVPSFCIRVGHPTHPPELPAASSFDHCEATHRFGPSGDTGRGLAAAIISPARGCRRPSPGGRGPLRGPVLRPEGPPAHRDTESRLPRPGHSPAPRRRRRWRCFLWWRLRCGVVSSCPPHPGGEGVVPATHHSPFFLARQF